MKTSPLFTKTAPFQAGEKRRDAWRSLMVWLGANEGKVVGGSLETLPKLPPGWHYENATIPGISPNRFTGYLPPLPRYILRAGPPPPPLKHRPRIGREEEGWRMREYNDAELAAEGWNPAEFLPFKTPPAPAPTPDWVWALLAALVMLCSIAVAFWSSTRKETDAPAEPVTEAIYPYRQT